MAPVPRKRRRRWPWVLLAVFLALIIGYGVWVWTSYRGIDRVDLGDALDPVAGDTTNYLLVGSDSRENLDPEAPDAAEPTVSGRRADTIIVLQVGPEGSLMMSVPRDLWVENPATGKNGRINGTYNDGPANLVNAVRQNLVIPIHHYAEVDFASFAGLIDAVGGITIDFPHPAFDPGSGLDVQTAGPVTLDGTQALAYVRARNYTEIIDGEPVKDPTADIGRQERQRQFLVTALSEVGSERNPIAGQGRRRSVGWTHRRHRIGLHRCAVPGPSSRRQHPRNARVAHQRGTHRWRIGSAAPGAAGTAGPGPVPLTHAGGVGAGQLPLRPTRGAVEHQSQSPEGPRCPRVPPDRWIRHPAEAFRRRDAHVYR
ncbi:MAG: LCP family protein [Microthrixaceae bacterium]